MSNWTLKENSTGVLELKADGEEWAKAIDKAFKKIAADTTLPGFRKGAAPLSMLRKRINEQAVYQRALNDNMEKWFEDAVNEHGLQLVDQASLEDMDANRNSCTVKIRCTVYPEAKIEDPDSIVYTVKEPEVTDEQVDAEIENIRMKYKEIEEKDTAEEGDTVNIDFEGLLDGEPFEGGTDKGHDLKLGSHTFIPGFEEGLIGAAAGDEKELNVTFPEDYQNEDLAGKAVVFKVKVNSVNTEVIPELDDDFAQDVNYPGVETVDDLKNYVRDYLMKQAEKQAKNDADTAVMQAITDAAVIDYIPEKLLADERDRFFQDQVYQMQQYGISISQYLETLKMSAEEFRNSFADVAENTVRSTAAVRAFAKMKDLLPTQEDIDGMVEKLAGDYKMTADEIRSRMDLFAIRDSLTMNKVLNFFRPDEEQAEEEAPAETVETVSE